MVHYTARIHSNMIINTFTAPVTSPYVAMDTETRTYIDGKLLTDAQIYSMCGQTRQEHGERVPVYPQSWWREHTVVKCWAWIVYAPEGLFIGETFDEWERFCVEYDVKCAWWYNAPFDFSVLDYEMLSRGWKHTDKPGAARTYSELASDMGARYTMTIQHPTVNSKGKPAKHTVKHYDLRNILHGGLKKLLESFDVRDADGNPIRKLEMDYQGGEVSQKEIEYMRNDAAGLWWLIDKASRAFETEYNLSIRGRKPDFITASGAAKKAIMRRMYPKARTDRDALKRYQRDHPITVDQDTYFRDRGLLAGGRVIMNPRYTGRELTGIRAYRLDCNSEYPYVGARVMKHIWGYPRIFDTWEHAREVMGKDATYIIEFARLHAVMRPDMLAAWRHPFTHKYVEELDIGADDPNYCIFARELAEMSNWYMITSYKIECVIAYNTEPARGLCDFLEDGYRLKSERKLSGDIAGSNAHKLMTNGGLGKLSQNPIHGKIDRVLIDGYVHMLTPTEEIDADGLLNVVEGALVTSEGRINLLRQARKQCRGNVALNLLYTDTDSVHILCEPVDTDPVSLGGWKVENVTPIVRAKFLAPKTYYEVEESGHVDIHCKGVNVEAIEKLVKRGVPLDKIYSYGYGVQSLSALNVSGGKALLPFRKNIALGIPEREETYD